MAKLGVIANPQAVPEWVAVCPTCGGPVQCGVEAWESETGIPLSEGLYVECAADDHEGEIETREPYIYWLPIQQRVLAWARLALRMVEGGLRPTSKREVWRVMAETSTIRKGLTPWGNLSALAFMRDMAREGGEATLRVVSRPDVASREW